MAGIVEAQQGPIPLSGEIIDERRLGAAHIRSVAPEPEQAWAFHAGARKIGEARLSGRHGKELRSDPAFGHLSFGLAGG